MAIHVAINGIPGLDSGYDDAVEPGAGGVDSRDRNIAAYVFGPNTGIVTPDCARWLWPGAQNMREWGAW